MEMNDMILVSVDDHLIEPGDMYDRQLSGDLLASAPKLITMNTGQSYWTYQGARMPVVMKDGRFVRDRLAAAA